MADGASFPKKVFEFSNHSFRVIKTSFGPNGLDCMVSTTSGTLLVTNDGFQILKSLCNPSPVGRLLFRSLEPFYKNSGDFSKKFVLLIRDLLREVLDVVQRAQEASFQQELGAIGQGMDVVLLNIFPKILIELTNLDVVINVADDLKSIEKTIFAIIRTNLNGKFSPKTCENLANILRKILFENEPAVDGLALRLRTEMLVDKFSEVFWEVPGRPLSSSVVLPGLIIPRHFVTLLKGLPHKSPGTTIKFIILGVTLGYDLPQAKTVLVLKDSQKVKAMLEWRSKSIECLIQQFVNVGVELIISSKTLHETVIHYCNQSRLAAIELVPQEDMRRICNLFSIHPMFEFELEKDVSSFVAEASSCKSIGVGQHTYVYLEPASIISTKQVLLYAPSQSMCRQYSVALQNTLKILRNAFGGQKMGMPSLSVVSGGGVFELGLAFALERYRNRNKVESNVELACRILEKALLSIPRQLLENSGRETSVCNVMAQARESLNSGKKVLGVNKNGTLSDLVQDDILETVVGNCHMVSSVVQLFVQIMKTDQIIHVKSLPSHNKVDVDENEDQNDF